MFKKLTPMNGSPQLVYQVDTNQHLPYPLVSIREVVKGAGWSKSELKDEKNVLILLSDIIGSAAYLSSQSNGLIHYDLCNDCIGFSPVRWTLFEKALDNGELLDPIHVSAVTDGLETKFLVNDGHHRLNVMRNRHFKFINANVELIYKYTKGAIDFSQFYLIPSPNSNDY